MPGVLLATASRSTAETARATLEAAGHGVRVSADGASALAELERVPAQVVVTEWNLPGLDGPRLCRAIRARPRLAATHVVALIPTEGAPGAQAALEAGADDSLEETFTRPELLARVATGLRVAELRGRAEAARHEAEARFREAFEAASIGMALVAPDGRCLNVNRTLCEIAGYAEHALLEKTFREITHPDDVMADADCLRELLAGKRRTCKLEKRLLSADGHSVWVLLSAALVRDADHEPLYFIFQVQDIRERKRYEGELRYLADHDALTGLYNRRRFAEEVERQRAEVRRYGVGAALVLLDLDNFKEVNDRVGHKVGDDLLRSVASALRQRMRESDTIARLGGDEFALLLPATSEGAAHHVAQEVVDVVRQQVLTVGERQVRITASAGVAAIDRTSVEDPLVEADLGLYEAKNAGGDRLAVHEAGAVPDRARRRFSRVERLRSALAHERFVLHYQPIVELRSGRVSQYEALLRLHDEGGELVLPGAFLYLLERFGFIEAVDRWVVCQAIALLAGHRVRPDLRLAVNLSAYSLGDPKLPTLVEDELSTASVDPSRLVFEVTEAAAIANVSQAKELARRLTRLGCGVALDDFGSSFASFYYLKQLPYQYLKIDGEFVRGLPDSPDDQLVVKALVEVARGMGKKTIAEFVGDEATQSLVRDYGVDYGQGFHLGRPQPLAEAFG